MSNKNMEKIIDSLTPIELSELAARLETRAGENPDTVRAMLGGNIEKYGKTINDILTKRREKIILNGDGKRSLTENIHTCLSPIGLRITAATDLGMNRGRNEDRVVIDTANEVYAVIDGMGGHEHGDKAADITAEAFLAYPRNIELAAQEAIWRFEQTNLDEKAGACFHAVQFHVDNKGAYSMSGWQAGDVRLLVLGKNNEILFESADESLVDELVHLKRIKPDQAHYHDMRCIVTNSVSLQNKERLRINRTVTWLPIESGSKVLLMSDGITDNFTTDEILKHTHGLDGQEIISTLNDMTRQRMLRHKEIVAQTPDRAKSGVYADGFITMPKDDNRAIIVIEKP